MAGFELIQRRKSNPVDLSLLDSTLSSMNKQHEENIGEYNKIITTLNALTVNEADKGLIQDKVNTIQSNIDNVVQNGLYHNAGTAIMQAAMDVANDPVLKQAVENQQKYESFEKEVNSSNLPDPMKEWVLGQNTFEAGKIKGNGVWEPVYKPVQSFNKHAIEDAAKESIIKELDQYKEIVYISGSDNETGETYYTTNLKLAQNTQPYYWDGAKFTPIPFNDIREKEVEKIYQTPEILASIDQDIKYYEHVYNNNLIPNEYNPLYEFDTITNSYKKLNRDEYIQKMVYGHSRNESADVFYNVNHILTSSVKDTPNEGVHIYDSKGNTILNPAIIKKNEELEKEEAKKLEKAREELHTIESRSQSHAILNTYYLQGENTKNIYEQCNASIVSLRKHVDDYNKHVPDNEKIDFDTFDYNDYLALFEKSNNINKEFILSVEHLRDDFVNGLNVIFTDDSVDFDKKMAAFRYYMHKYDFSGAFLSDLMDDYSQYWFNDSNERDKARLIAYRYKMKSGAMANASINLQSAQPININESISTEKIRQEPENLTSFNISYDDTEALIFFTDYCYEIFKDRMNPEDDDLSDEHKNIVTEAIAYNMALNDSYDMNNITNIHNEVDDEYTTFDTISFDDYVRLSCGGLTDTEDITEVNFREKTFRNTVNSALQNLPSTAQNKNMWIRDKNGAFVNIKDGTNRATYGSLIATSLKYDLAQISVDPSTGRFVIQLTRPSSDHVVNSGEDSKYTIKAKDVGFNTLYKNAGLSSLPAESITVFAIDDVLETDIQKAIMNETDLKYTSEASRVKNSKLNSYVIGSGRGKRTLFFDDTTGKTYYINNNYEETEISDDMLPNVFKGRDIYNNVMYELKYGSLKNKESLSSDDITMLSGLNILFLDIIQNTSYTDEVKTKLIFEGIYDMINEINPAIAVLYKKAMTDEK